MSKIIPSAAPVEPVPIDGSAPATGKSAVALAVAEHLHAVYLSIDPVEDAMLGAGLPAGWTTGVAAYEARASRG